LAKENSSLEFSTMSHSSDDLKARVQKAIGGWHDRQKPKQPTRKNQKPEKELEKTVMAWLKLHGFHCTVVEAKSTFNPVARRYISQSVKAGTVDVIGNDSEGRAVFIELKAPGRRSTLSEKQRDFLELKISQMCFAVCIDSVEMLAETYSHWLSLPPLERQKFLLAQLPSKKTGPAESDPFWP
jgi:hypothetical protein